MIYFIRSPLRTAEENGNLVSIKPEEGFGKGDSALWTEQLWASQRPQAVKNLIFQDLKRKLSSFAAIVRLSSRAKF